MSTDTKKRGLNNKREEKRKVPQNIYAILVLDRFKKS